MLLDVEENQLRKLTSEKLADLIMKNREGKLEIRPGYDGEYGKLIVGEVPEEKAAPPAKTQKGLDEFY